MELRHCGHLVRLPSYVNEQDWLFILIALLLMAAGMFHGGMFMHGD